MLAATVLGMTHEGGSVGPSVVLSSKWFNLLKVQKPKYSSSVRVSLEVERSKVKVTDVKMSKSLS